MCKQCPPDMLERMVKLETIVENNTKLSQERHVARIDVEKEHHMVIMGSMEALKKALADKELDKRYPTRRELYASLAGISACFSAFIAYFKFIK
ncbi:MAG: hypothetical protein U9O94_06010 [Nanoarchaeota archaeon]|nr:hypothetical protein [Nanoarchaeota archaeon]